MGSMPPPVDRLAFSGLEGSRDLISPTCLAEVQSPVSLADVQDHPVLNEIPQGIYLDPCSPLAL